ncbi:endonuclease dU [Haloarcula brevis]|uniref:endonuclease dU n=1 Tax=Haloarcula brevis TaxID=3111453 RepID=UPI00300EFE70
MKSGARALGFAESYRAETSQFAGAVVRASRAVDGFVFGTATVGGTDATETVCEMVDRLDREDVRYLLVAGIAPAWFNVLDLRRLHAETDLPVVSVTFESSPGLEGAIREAFDDPEAVRDRLATYRDQPARRPVSVNGETVYARSVGIDDSAAADVVRAFTPEGGRPEPLRVARLAARGLVETERPGD